MIGGFSYKNIHSSTFGLICKSVNKPILPPLRPNVTEIQGKHGIIDYGGNTFGSRSISVHIAYGGTSFEELRRKAREIAAWLFSLQWERLIFDDEPYKYYKARIYDEIGLQNIFRFGEADIAFECQPFAYQLITPALGPTWMGTEETWAGTEMKWEMFPGYHFPASGASTAVTFDNPGTVNTGQTSPQGGNFKITLDGSWTTISIGLNGKTLNYTASGTGVLVIDNLDMTVELDGTNKLDEVTGDLDSFLALIPGPNTITVSGSGVSVDVTIDFIPEVI